MASSSGQGVTAVMLLKFLTSGDPRQNCEKLIQLLKDWCELDGWYDTEPLPPPTKEGVETPLARLAKGKAMAAFCSAIVTEAMKNRLSALRGGREGTRDYSQTFEGTFHSE